MAGLAEQTASQGAGLRRGCDGLNPFLVPRLKLVQRDLNVGSVGVCVLQHHGKGLVTRELLRRGDIDEGEDQLGNRGVPESTVQDLDWVESSSDHH